MCVASLDYEAGGQIATRYIYVIELKLKNNGGKEAAVQQILANQYMEPFQADKREVVGLGIELDEEGRGLLDWKEVKNIT